MQGPAPNGSFVSHFVLDLLSVAKASGQVHVLSEVGGQLGLMSDMRLSWEGLGCSALCCSEPSVDIRRLSEWPSCLQLWIPLGTRFCMVPTWPIAGVKKR